MVRRIDFKRFLRKEIKPNSRVLVVGAGNIRRDPSTFFVNSLVEKKGKLVVFDTMKYRELREDVSTYGGLEEFKSSWAWTKNKKLPHLIAGAVAERPLKIGIPLKTGSVDVVYDHFALHFMKFSGTPYEEIVSEYLRVVKPGGKLIITDPPGSIIHGKVRLKHVRETDYRMKYEEMWKRFGCVVGPQHRAHRVLIIKKAKPKGAKNG